MTKKKNAAEIANKEPSKKGNPNWVKGGPSPNPAGAPKRGESWQELIKRVGELTPTEAAERSIALAQQLKKIGDGITLKEAVVLRVYGALLFDPQASLLNAFMDRAEGKIAQTVELTVYDSLAKKLGVSTSEAREYAAKVASGEMTIDDILTGKARLPVENPE